MARHTATYERASRTTGELGVEGDGSHGSFEVEGVGFWGCAGEGVDHDLAYYLGLDGWMESVGRGSTVHGSTGYKVSGDIDAYIDDAG